MNEFVRVGQILSNCLTPETIKKYYPSWKRGNSDQVLVDKGVKDKLFVDLLEHSGEVLTSILKRDLTSDEVMLVYNRVQQLLIARGLD